MGSATARCFSLFPLLLQPRPSFHHLLRSFATAHRQLSLSPPFLSPLQCSHHPQFHTHSLNLDEPHFPAHESNHRALHPWPEWFEFVNWVSCSGYSNGSVDSDDFVKDLPLDFLRLANGCLAFARKFPDLLWSLPREDIEVVVDSGSPFLFKDASSATRRMKAFLGSGTNDVLKSDIPSTVDLMRFLLSYVGIATVSPDNIPADNRVELSVRKLFSELAKSRGISAESIVPVKKQSPGGLGQPLRSSGKSIEMKRGDWICPRCSFMNFAKNSKCLECEEPRPMKYLTGREWECPQCNFLNFGRNVKCLRCDSKKPSVSPSSSSEFISGLAANSSSSQGDKEIQLTGTEEEKQQSWLTKINQLEKSSVMSSSVAVDFHETKVIGNLGSHGKSDDYDLQKPGLDSNVNVEISQYFDEALGENFSTSISNKGANFTRRSRDASSTAISRSPSTGYGHVGEANSNENPSGQMRDKDRKQAEKSESWFKRAAELHDVTDLPSAISHEDFPEIMPMRKGENRFVVSKKKDRSLTSPMYKRRMAIEQASNNNYVPFVPFPPGYFAKDKPKEGSESVHVTSNNSDSVTAASQRPGAMGTNSGGTEGKEDVPNTPVYNAYNNINQTSRSSDSQFRSKSPDGYSKTGSTTGTNFDSASSQSSESQSIRGIWRGRSLEGSAVKELDPLDMSEEAKAERWFRRVAQIKDISELSQIPDEDFPSIMPLRKGVNRFVVSKRKTPLERRLTSSRYRRNLPTVGSDQVKKGDDLS